MLASGEDPVDVLSDVDLAKCIADIRKAQQGRPSITSLIDVSDAYVAKCYYKEEDVEDTKRAMLMAQGLGVSVPAFKRVIRREDTFELIQARIHGQDLMTIWPNIGLVSTVRLAFQLRRMVRRMQTATSPTAGSLGTGLCRSFWIDNDRYGIPPYASPTTISSIVNFWYNLVNPRREASKTPEQHRESCLQPTAPEKGFVFTHHDLAPRNIMLESETGKLWLADWDYAGFYPSYFEHAAMHNFIPPAEWSWFARWRWRLFAWIATGLYSGKAAILAEVRRKTLRFPPSRRFNIKAGATLSVKPADD
ncbi:Aminoglycoside phosphotransferase domain-containing protein [Madurella fahalii]|uniref:Aminoglycoside phosphotransferase domain-containing protein n=1 Tax=Madurella fahalii TaxID=1157608 RepID=A0ABQ0GKY4_9PEZI